MFETLYDEDVIAEDAYFQWEKSEDSPGKGVALKQVAAFLTWLHEAEEDDDWKAKETGKKQTKKNNTHTHPKKPPQNKKEKQGKSYAFFLSE